MNKYYLTAAIPYVNAAPHIGHALEFVQADVIKRFKQKQGLEVTLLSGGDENALKNVQAAEKTGEPIQEFVDKNNILFEKLTDNLDTKFDIWQKGSSQNHHKSSQRLWELCATNDDIYKKTYTGLYCIGCELFYEKNELNENGECHEHPGKKLDEISEENYFFRLSKYQDQILNLLEKDEIKIIPIYRKTEAINFVKQGLEDISISRSNQRAKNWGVPVPGDITQRIYVWFDALNIYQSGIGFGWDEEKYKRLWPADLHVIGKGILRFHAIYWPAFLLSAGLKLPKSLFVHGYFTVNGQKMSKTLGNVIDPNEMIKKYGVDAIRYYLLAEIPPTSDGDFSEERLKEVYNADLANGLGNLVARVAKLCETSKFKQPTNNKHISENKGYEDALEQFKFDEGLKFIWNKIDELNKYVDENKPWELEKNNDLKLKDVLSHLVDGIQEIAELLEPFLPRTSEKIREQFSRDQIKSSFSLFPRI
jgi:methionyl-tRNA synthetase